MKKIAVLVGSMRADSFSRKTANELISMFGDNVEAKIVEINNLPLYNSDLETATPPAAWSEFRNSMKEVDGVLFVTPEYNRSVPAVLKNAIDVGSMPYGNAIWNDLPGAIVSIAQGNIGGFGANHHLRQAVVFLDVHVMQTPEVYLSNIQDMFNSDDKIENQATRDFLKSFTYAFEAWIDRLN